VRIKSQTGGVNNITGNYNTATGSRGGNQSGDRLTAVGYSALANNNYGHNNTALGSQALYLNTGGTRNLALGFQAGYYQTTRNNNIYLASYGVGGESNTMRPEAGLGERLGRYQAHLPRRCLWCARNR
jgi:hypothetical protein